MAEFIQNLIHTFESTCLAGLVSLKEMVKLFLAGGS